MQNRPIASVRRPRVLRSTEIEMYWKDPLRTLTVAELRERSDPDTGKTVIPHFRPAPYSPQATVLKASLVEGHPDVQPIVFPQAKTSYPERSCLLLAAPSSTP